MQEQLPPSIIDFKQKHPQVWDAFDKLGEVIEKRGFDPILRGRGRFRRRHLSSPEQQADDNQPTTEQPVQIAVWPPAGWRD